MKCISELITLEILKFPFVFPGGRGERELFIQEVSCEMSVQC